MDKMTSRRAMLHWCLLFFFVAWVCAAPANAQEPFHPALNPQRFPVPDALIPNVQFWHDVFSRHASTQTVIHDDQYLDIVFSVVDVGDLVRQGASAATIERTGDRRARDEVRKYQQVLLRLAGARVAADETEVGRVRAMYAAKSRLPTDYRAAAMRVRGQGGLKDRFQEAIQISGMFMEGIEQILVSHGVPTEVRCLPFVESMFNYKARSRVGASGVWQFTASTGRRYLQMNSAVDARSDVWLAADGAARMLADHYARVQSWPLALTAYNHGISGMVRAVRQVGTSDIGVVSQRYRSPSFGFASRNFYAEFVAAVTVFADRERLFPGVEPMPARRFEEFAPGAFVSLLDLANLTETPVSELVELNPALHQDVARGQLLVPPTYPLRVADGSRGAFERAFAQLPDTRKRDRQITATYRIQRGDTLGAIARRLGTSVSALQRANGIARANRIRAGQLIEVPGGSGQWTPLVWSPDTEAPGTRASAQAGIHIVRTGETLTQIAARYGLTVRALVAANEIPIPNRILVGMQIAIPESAQSVVE